jgi:hypothetical protein
MTRSERGPMWVVEEAGREGWTFRCRAHTESEARQSARICGFTEPADARRVEEEKRP